MLAHIQRDRFNFQEINFRTIFVFQMVLYLNSTAFFTYNLNSLGIKRESIDPVLGYVYYAIKHEI